MISDTIEGIILRRSAHEHERAEPVHAGRLLCGSGARDSWLAQGRHGNHCDQLRDRARGDRRPARHDSAVTRAGQAGLDTE